MDLQQIIEATQQLTVSELGELVDHLGDGSFAELRKEPWAKHVTHLLPADNDADAIHTLWVVLTNVHSDRFMANKTPNT